MDKLRRWVKRRLLQATKRLAVWALTKLAVAGIDEANGERLGRELKTRLPEPIWKAVDGYLGEIRVGLRG